MTFIALIGETENAILIANRGEPRLVCVDVPDQAIPSQRARAIADALRSNGYEGQTVVMALSSSVCFPASVALSGLPRIDGNTLLYKLEEKLPFAAESVVADFLVTGDRALGVCVKPEWLSPLLQSLASVGVDVSAIMPAALLAAQGCEGASADFLVIPEHNTLNLIALRDGRPAQWATVPASRTDVVDQAELMSPEPSPTFAATRDVDLEHQFPPLSMTSLDAMARAALTISSGAAPPWLNFRKGVLAAPDKLHRHRRPLNALLATALIFLLTVALAAIARGQRYRAIEANADHELRAAFLAQFPNWSGPINLAIIEAEQRRTLAAAGNAPRIAQSDALKNLAAVLSHLPADEHVSIQRMSFGEGSFELEGRASDYDRIDTLVSAARGAGLNVPQPQTRKGADNAWTFVLRGERSSDASARAKDAGEPR